MDSNNYINIQWWMISELGLSGNSLLVYAIIYGFSQGIEEQTFSGGLSYLCKWTNSTKQGVLKNIKILIERGFIEKKERIENGVKKVEYYSTKFNGGGKQSLMGGGKQSLTNNNIYKNNIYNKLENIQNNVLKEELKKYVDFRKERKKPLTETNLEYAIKKLDKIANKDDDLKIKIIQQSLENGWLGLFPLKNIQKKEDDSFLEEMVKQQNERLGLK